MRTGRLAGLGGLALALFLTLAAAATRAQGTVTPDTEPSERTTGAKDAKPSSSAPGAATVQGRELSNGVAPGQPDPDAGPTRPKR